jgi:hypothetical protein
MAQAEHHVVLPEPVVHVDAEVGLDLHVDQQRYFPPRHRHPGDEIHLPPVADGPVVEIFLVQEGGLPGPQARIGVRMDDAEEVGKEEFDQVLRKLVVAGQVRSPMVGAAEPRGPPEGGLPYISRKTGLDSCTRGQNCSKNLSWEAGAPSRGRWARGVRGFPTGIATKTPGKGVSPLGRGLSPLGNGLSPLGRGVSLPGNGLSLPGNGLSLPGNGLSPPGRGVSPPLSSPPCRYCPPPHQVQASPSSRSEYGPT